MKELRFVARTHAEVLVHLGVLRLDSQPFLLGEVGDLSRVDFDRPLYGSFVFEWLHGCEGTLSSSSVSSGGGSTLVSLSGGSRAGHSGAEKSFLILCVFLRVAIKL